MHQNWAGDPIALFRCGNPVQNQTMILGDARVSTDGQSVDPQVRQLRAVGCEKIYREKASGANTDRAQLRRVLDQLDAGDVLMVTRLDRLAARRAIFSTPSPRSPAKRPASDRLGTHGPTPRPRTTALC
jgi:hypothetical protein